MTKSLQIFPSLLWEEYQSEVSGLHLDLPATFLNLKEAEISTSDFSFYTSVASVYSSKIEGEAIELDSYVKHKKLGIEFLPDYTKKIDDLYAAYTYAQNQKLTAQGIAQAHKLLSKHIVAKQYQGRHRTHIMFVSTPKGKIEYVAPGIDEVNIEMEKFYHDLQVLLKKPMNTIEAFFYASWVHLVFVKIHPFNDGNGRSARLLEKWFLAQKLGPQAWFVQSEQNYYQKHPLYYTNLRALGLEYPDLDYSKALPFLMMLPHSLTLSD